MTQTIYIDVLVGINLFINYFTLIATAKFLYLKFSKRRLLLGSILGSIYSLYILLPEINPFLSLIVKLIMSITIILVSFNIKNMLLGIKTTIIFYLINFVFLGIVFLFWYVFRSPNVIINNSLVYFNISPITLIISTIVSYIILRLTARLTDKDYIKNYFCDVEVFLDNKSKTLLCKVDTGNSLREPFSKLPVIVVKKQSLQEILCPQIQELIRHTVLDYTKYQDYIIKNKNLRLIPFRTISGDGMLIGIKAQKIVIKKKIGDIIREGYIGICDNNKILSSDVDALINPELVNL